MCYNCGCGIPDDDMGRGKISEGGSTLTEDDIKFMAEKWGMSVKETKEHIYELLKQELGK